MLQIEEGRRVLYALEEAGPSGVGAMLLSDRCEILLDRLREYLQERREFFIKLDDGPNYTLNRFGAFKGSVDAMVSHLQLLHDQEIGRKWRFRALGLFVLGLYMGTQLDGFFSIWVQWWNGTLV